MPFSELSRAGKLRVTSELRQRSSRKLVFAAASATYQEGRRSAGRLVEAAGSPVRGPHLAAALSAGPSAPPQPYTVEEALAMLVDLSLTKAQYVTMQQGLRHRGADMYPVYDRVRQAKAASMPPPSSLTVTAGSAKVALQALLDHTAERLLQVPAVREAVASACLSTADLSAEPAAPPRLMLHVKWGMDGSTGHSQYKMADSEEDSQLLLTSLVPLRLTADDGRVLWTNPSPSSPRLCRPLSLFGSPRRRRSWWWRRENE